MSYTVKLFCRGGKDFFVLVMDQLMFVKGFDKHWCKYPNYDAVNAVRIFTNYVLIYNDTLML